MKGLFWLFLAIFGWCNGRFTVTAASEVEYFCRLCVLMLHLLYKSGLRMCVAYILSYGPGSLSGFRAGPPHTAAVCSVSVTEPHHDLIDDRFSFFGDTPAEQKIHTCKTCTGAPTITGETTMKSNPKRSSTSALLRIEGDNHKTALEVQRGIDVSSPSGHCHFGQRANIDESRLRSTVSTNDAYPQKKSPLPPLRQAEVRASCTTGL